MRAVTFSTPKIQDAINNNFVALTTNIEGDDLAGGSVSHSPSDQPGNCIRGNGRQNVQTIFLTPDLKVMHAVTGFISPAELFEEMKFAVNIKKQMDASPESSIDVVQAMHRDRLTQLSKTGSIGNGHANDDGWNGSSDQNSGMSGLRGTPSEMASNPGFRMFINNSLNNDHTFCARNPLIDAAKLDADPGGLVGRGKTYFSSSNNASSNRSGR